MKKIVFFIILVYFLSCDNKNNEGRSFTDDELENLLTFAILVSDGFPNAYIYKHYENQELKNIISKLYEVNSTEYGYEFDESVMNYINTRINRPVPILTNFDSVFNVNYVKDTSNFNKDLMIYSEPFYINDSLICFSSTILKVEKIKKKKVFFVIKKRDKMKFFEYYDVNKDVFYRQAELK